MGAISWYDLACAWWRALKVNLMTVIICGNKACGFRWVATVQTGRGTAGVRCPQCGQNTTLSFRSLAKAHAGQTAPSPGKVA